MDDLITQSQEKSYITIACNRIITGFFIVIPVGITAWLCVFVFNFMTEWSTPFIREIEYLASFNNVFWFNFIVRCFSLLVILASLFIIGQVAKYALARRTMLIIESFIESFPIISTVYSTARQVVDAIKGTKGGMFRKVVLVEFPRKGVFAIAFLTNDSKISEIDEKTGKELLAVFLPPTPNPTSGFLLFVPREECIFLEMSVADAMKLIISGGAVMPIMNNTNPIPQP